MLNLSREDGFTISEMLVSTTVMLLVMGAALGTFKNALAVNDSASQLADANQNLRAGTNQLIRDLLMAGRIIGAEGIAMPTGPVGSPIIFARPGPTALTFSLYSDPDNPTDATLQLPSLSTGYRKGAVVNGSYTDLVTIMTVDEFMPVIMTPPGNPSSPTQVEGIIAPDGASITFPTNSLWWGDVGGDTVAIEVGDLVLFKSAFGNAIQTVTKKDATHIYFAATGSDAANDFFHFNQPNATNQTAGTGRPLAAVKQATRVDPSGTTTGTNLTWPVTCPTGTVMTSSTAWCGPVTLFRAMMITYYVDNASGTPRLMRQLNHKDAACPLCPVKFDPQALAGVVEDMDLTYDLYDGTCNPTEKPDLPVTLTCGTASVLYTSSLIRKVNIHVGVRSEVMSKPNQDYVRNHIYTSVNVRSLAQVDRYVSQ